MDLLSLQEFDSTVEEVFWGHLFIIQEQGNQDSTYDSTAPQVISMSELAWVMFLATLLRICFKTGFVSS